jgi:hypothetical protein
MVNPAWFFSTLSQGTAAIAGLLVSARLIQYQLERQRRLRRTEELRTETREFKKKFGHIISPITGTFASSADLSFFTETQSLTLPGDELNLKIAMQANMPVVTLYWAHFARISYVFRTGGGPSPKPKQHSLFSEKEFDRLRESIGWLKRNIDERSMFIDNLYADLGIQGKQKYSKDVFDPDPPGESLQDWLQRYLDYAARHSSLVSGKNLSSYQRVIGELNRDFQRLDSLRENSLITFNPNIASFLAKSFLLIVVGVILPLAATVSNTPQFLSWLILDSTALFLYQILLLAATVALIYTLLDDIQQEFSDASLTDHTKEYLNSVLRNMQRLLST